MKEKEILFPKALESGDTIAICSPASPVDAYKVEGARNVLEKQGWKVRVMPHALGSYGSYAAKDDERLDDMVTALTDPEVRAVLCSRGGYGVVHIMEELDNLDLRHDPKWIIGFSDISALHALAVKQGIASIHASMAEHIMKGPGDPDNAMLFKILRGEKPVTTFPSSPGYDRTGMAQGRIVGGNLAVLADLIGTRYDVFEPDTILFIEDVGEPIYKIERIIYQLRISGILDKIAGLMVGQFTKYLGDRNYNKMEDMVSDMVSPYTFPVAFNVPIGHVEHNIPIIENAYVTLKVTPTDSNSIIYWNTPS